MSCVYCENGISRVMRTGGWMHPVGVGCYEPCTKKDLTLKVRVANRGIFTIFAHASLAADGTLDLDIAQASQHPKAGATEIAPHDSAGITIHQGNG